MSHFFTGSAIAVKKKLLIAPGSDDANFDGKTVVIRLGSSNKYLSFTGWSPASIVTAWNGSQDPLIGQITAEESGGGVLFSHDQPGEDFELTVEVDSTLLLASEVYELAFLHNATGGTFTITFNGQTTAAITYVPGNTATTVANILAALNALSNVQNGDILVSYVSGTTYKLDLSQGAYAGLEVPAPTVDYLNLTGGDVQVQIETVQQGSAGQNEIQEIDFPIDGTYNVTRNEKQQFYFSGGVSGGTFKASLNGVNWTDPIPWNATASVFKTYYEALPQVGAGNTICTGGALPTRAIKIEYVNDLAGTNVAQIQIDVNGLLCDPGPGVSLDVSTLANGSGGYTFFAKCHLTSDPSGKSVGLDFRWNRFDVPILYQNPQVLWNESNATITAALEKMFTATVASAGTFKLTFDGQTTAPIAFNASAATVQTALEALSNIAPGDVTVSGSNGNFTFKFAGAYATGTVPRLTGDGTGLVGANAVIPSVWLSRDEKQGFSLTNAELTTGIQLEFDGQWTAVLYNGSQASIQAALEGLSTIGAGNVQVTIFGADGGLNLAAGGYEVRFIGTLAKTALPEIGIGTNPTVDRSAIEVQEGVSATRFEKQDITINATQDGIFDTGNVTVSGSLDGSWLDPGDPSFDELTITWSGKLAPQVGPLVPGHPDAYFQFVTQNGDPIVGGPAGSVSFGTTGTAGNVEWQRLILSGNPPGGGFKLRFGGQTTNYIPFSESTAARIKSELLALSSIGQGPNPYNIGLRDGVSVTMSGGGTLLVAHQADIMFVGNGLQCDNVAQIEALLFSDNTAVPNIVTTQQGGVVTLQYITGGTYNLRIQKTGGPVYRVLSIPYNVTAADLETRINAVLGAGSVNCTGGPHPSTPIDIEFIGNGYQNSPMETIIVELSITGNFGGSAEHELVRAYKVPERTDNVWELTVIPGQGTLAVLVGDDIAYNFLYLAINQTTEQEAIRLRWTDLTAARLENTINEAFGKEVVKVTRIVHSQEWAKLSVNAYSASQRHSYFWYFRDVFRLVFVNDYADPATIESMNLIFPQSPSGVGSDMPDPENWMQLGGSGGGDVDGMGDPGDAFGNNIDDLEYESARTYYGFVNANQIGSPIHKIVVSRSVQEVSQELVTRFKFQTQYVLADQYIAVGRVGIAELMADMQVRLVWGRRTGNAESGYSYSPILRTDWINWDSPANVVQYALERMAENDQGVELDDSEFVTAPAGMFGSGNVTVEGSLYNSWLPETDNPGFDADSYNDLRVTLTGKLSRLPLQEYGYCLWAEIGDPDSFISGNAVSAFEGNSFTVTDPYNPIRLPRLTWDNISVPLPPLRSERQRITLLSDDNITNVYLYFDGHLLTVTPDQTAAEIQTTINAAVGQFARLPGSGVPSLPEKFRQSVTVYGTTFRKGPMEFEFNGYGYQYKDVETLTLTNIDTEEEIVTVVTLQEGLIQQPEIQRVRVNGEPRSGNAQLTISGQTTGNLDKDTTAAELDTALEGLSTVGVGKVVCTGGPWNEDWIICTFHQSLNNVAQMTQTNTFVNASAEFTRIGSGGADGSLVVRELVRGAGPKFWDVPENWNVNEVVSSQGTAIIDFGSQPIQFGMRQRADFVVCRMGAGVSRMLWTNRRVTFLDGMKVYVSTTDTLPAGLVEGYYYVRNVSDDATFQLSLTANGAVIDLTSSGVGTHTTKVRELTLQQYSRFVGQEIGLSRTRANGQQEYLCQYLTAGFTSIELGIEEGDGLTLGRFNTTDEDCDVLVHKTGSSRIGNIPAVNFLCNNANLDIVQQDGEVGVAAYSDESASLRSLTQYDGELVINNTTFADKLYINGGSHRILNMVPGTQIIIQG